jgi:HAD superfamily hydrolase (TIGR01509 family)
MDESAIDDDGGIRTLLFDLGGVIIDFDFDRAFRFWAARASCEPAEIGRRFSLDEPYEQHERGELHASDYFASLRRSLNVSLSDDELIEGWNDVYLGVMPGIVAMLTIAGERFPLYAFTNSNPTHQSEWSVRFAKELSIFKNIFVSSELGLRKPDPEAFSEVASRTGFSVSEFLFFDDTPENIDGARSAGMHAVLVESNSNVREALLQLGLNIGA